MVHPSQSHRSHHHLIHHSIQHACLRCNTNTYQDQLINCKLFSLTMTKLNRSISSMAGVTTGAPTARTKPARPNGRCNATMTVMATVDRPSTRWCTSRSTAAGRLTRLRPRLSWRLPSALLKPNQLQTSPPSFLTAPALSVPALSRPRARISHGAVAPPSLART